MKLREIKIKNFRCLTDVTIPIGDATVLVGENNTGKTALLDALRIILTRSPTGRIPFDEYDYHMSKMGVLSIRWSAFGRKGCKSSKRNEISFLYPVILFVGSP